MLHCNIMLSKQELYRLYELEGYSTIEIAKMFECAQSTVNRRMKKFGIKSRHQRIKEDEKSPRRCKYCHEVKPYDEFYPSKGKYGGKSFSCIQCTYIALNCSRYNITPEEWREMYEFQDGKCLICGNKDRPGIIGNIGSVLGKKGINIAHMTWARRSPTGEAIVVLNTDEIVDKDTLEEIKTINDIKWAKCLEL